MQRFKLVLTQVTDRFDVKYLLYIALLYFVLTTSLKEIYLYLDYTSPLGLRDLVIFQQPLHNFITAGTFEISVGPHVEQLVFGEHAYFFLVLLIPFYCIFPSPLLLLLSQPLAYVLMIYLANKLLKNVYQENLEIVTLFTTLLLINPTYTTALLNLAVYGFHLDFYFPALFLAAYYFYKQKTLPGFLLCYTLSLLIIEYYAIIWILFSLYNIFRRKHIDRVNCFLFLFSTTYLLLTFLFLIPYFRGTSLPWYAAKASDLLVGLNKIDIVALCKALAINLIFNFGVFLFLPLKNYETIVLTLPLYLIFIVASAAGYIQPLSPISWHSNALYPLILIGYIKEFSKIHQLTTKFTLLKLSFVMAIVLCTVLQASKNYNDKDLYLLTTKYALFKEDFDKIQYIKNQIKDAKILVSFQLGKYFGDVKEVNALDSRSDIDNGVKYILYYSGERIVPVDDQKMDNIREKYTVKMQYKDITVFERSTPKVEPID